MSLSVFRDPPQPSFRATTVTAVREHLLNKLRLLYPDDPERAICAEAETIFMDNMQLNGYLALCELGHIHHETAAVLIQRTPHEHIQECVRQLTEAAV